MQIQIQGSVFLAEFWSAEACFSFSHIAQASLRTHKAWSFGVLKLASAFSHIAQASLRTHKAC